MAAFQGSRHCLHGQRRQAVRGPHRRPCAASAPSSAPSPTPLSAPTTAPLSAPASAPTPLLDALIQRGTQTHELPFHVPGHKRGHQVLDSFRRTIGTDPLKYDLTEIPGLDCLSSASGVLADAQQLAAQAFGADRSWFLVNGCTAGIHAAILACAGPGDALLVARNCHLSVVSGMVLSGCQPYWVVPDMDPEFGIAHGMSPGALRSALQCALAAGCRVRGVMLVSPTYFGAVSPIKELADICHEHNIPLLVDEAHGAHFGTTPGLPPSALSQGADCTIHSTHKVLSAMTQAAMLHVHGARMDHDRITRALQILQSSSPSYVLMASLDAARAMLSQPDFLAEAMETAKYIAGALHSLPGIKLLGHDGSTGDVAASKSLQPPMQLTAQQEHERWSDEGSNANASASCSDPAGQCRREDLSAATGSHKQEEPILDPLRFTLGVWGLGLTGFEVAVWLEHQHGVVVELATSKVVVCALGPGTRMLDGQGLVRAFQDLSQQQAAASETLQSQRDSGDPCASSSSSETDGATCGKLVPQAAPMTPREAFFAATERVRREEAVGRVSAELLCPYPPGVPTVVPGELITAAALQQLLQAQQQGGTVTGASDPTLATFAVVA